MIIIKDVLLVTWIKSMRTWTQKKVIFHGGEANQQKISKHFKGSNFWVENDFFNKSLENGITWLKKTAGKRSKDFQKIVRMDKKTWIGKKKLVTSRQPKARSSHRKKGNDHMCYINEIMYKWIRSDRFEKHFRVRFDKTK